jgi:pyruvate/2-oxoglutarate dehydrogenase complex dihydrolipoamide acyltransferase (E2) component
VASWRPSRDGRIYARMEIEATPLLEYAAALSAASGVRVTLTHVVGKAVGAGLRAVPAFNARVVFGRVVPYPRVDVGFAVDVSDGDDLAPVTLRGVDGMSTLDIAREIAERTGRVRAGGDRDFATANTWVRVAPRFLTRPVLAFASLWNGGLGLRAFGQPGFPLGGAFVSNVGSLGLDEGSLAPLPLARCPLYACIGAVRERAVVVDGAVVARPVFVLTATADHRIVDGAHAARLAAFLRSALAEPASLD